MKTILKRILIIMIVSGLLFGPTFKDEVKANTYYVNETANVSFSFSTSTPVSAQIMFTSSVALNSKVAIAGDPINNVYVRSFNASTSFTPRSPGTYSVTATVRASDVNENSISIASQTKTITVINKPAPTPPPASKPSNPSPSNPSPSKPAPSAPSSPAAPASPTAEDTKSTNNLLRSLTVSPGSLNFNPITTAYRVVVENSVTSINIGATAADAESTVTGAGSKSLSIYDNNFTIGVKAENGAVRNYTVNVVRKDENGSEKSLPDNINLKSLSVDGCEIEFEKDKLNYKCKVDNLTIDAEVKAEVEDVNAKFEILGNKKLKIGENEVKVIVTAENGDKKEYIIVIDKSNEAPTVNLEDLEDALKVLTADDIIVISDDKNIIKKSVFDKLKASKKILYVHTLDKDDNIIYKWKFDGSKIDKTFDVKTNLNFDSKNIEKIDVLSNYAKGQNLVLDENVELMVGTELGVFVGDDYKDKEILNLYFYNNEDDTLSLEHEALEVKDGFVWMPLEHTSEYFLTPASIQDLTDNQKTWMISTIVLGIGLTLSLGSIIIKNRKDKQVLNNIQL